jgi:hypothetical protein
MLRVSTSNNGQDPTMQTREIRIMPRAPRLTAVAASTWPTSASGDEGKAARADRLMAEHAHRRRRTLWPFGNLIGWLRSVSHCPART